MPQASHSTQRGRKSAQTVAVGLASNVLLAGLKTIIGVIGHSPALLADGINSTSDVVYYVVVAIFMRMARTPPDDQHPYGHRQLESIAALVVGAFVLTTAVAIFWNSINGVFDLLSGQRVSQGAALIALWVALFTVAAKIGLTVFTRQIGRQMKNTAVLALAYDHRNDALAATAATLGILLGRMGYAWIDPLAGALVAVVILRTGIQIVRGSISDLMDTGLGRALSDQVNRLVAPISGVNAVEEIRAHRFGPYLVLNLTIGVDGSLSVAQGDAIATQVEEALTEGIEFVRDVRIHYHPSASKSVPPSFPEPKP
jgi:cation diffusion facilitator family transporter